MRLPLRHAARAQDIHSSLGRVSWSKCDQIGRILEIWEKRFETYLNMVYFFETLMGVIFSFFMRVFFLVFPSSAKHFVIFNHCGRLSKTFQVTLHGS
jgi:hypothetical protein